MHIHLLGSIFVLHGRLVHLSSRLAHAGFTVCGVDIQIDDLTRVQPCSLVPVDAPQRRWQSLGKVHDAWPLAAGSRIS